MRKSILIIIMAALISSSIIADIFLIIGSTGEVAPASGIPYMAKERGAKIIEVNIEPSSYTNSITDVFLNGRAVSIMERLYKNVIANK